MYGMSLVEDFKASVLEKYPDFYITPLGSTSHTNVLKLTKDDKYYIAKSVWFDSDNASNEARAQRAFETEVSILKSLPDSWPVKYIDSFVSASGLNRIIITTEFENCKWSTLRRENYETIARSIERQLRWLHANNISHGDLELKNILLSCDQKSAVIIDFEKSKIGITTLDKIKDKKTLLSAVEDDFPAFKRYLSTILEGRRASIAGGTRSQRRLCRRLSKKRKVPK